jgi:Uma2 family endonuclease
MSTAIEPVPFTPFEAGPPIRYTAADLLHELGDISPDRVHIKPTPGTATLEDLIAWNERHTPTCEWIDGTLVEKAMGQFEGWLTSILIGEFYLYLKTNDLGLVYTPDVVLRILPGLGRAADVAFVPWSALPGGKPPPREDAVPEVVPTLAVEVLSKTNTRTEMTRKRGEYFRAGVKIVWEIDPATKSARVYTSPKDFLTIPPDGSLDGGDVMPGFSLSLRAIFDKASGNR